MTATEAIDIAWVLVCAALVLLMHARFTALESGLVRSKNSINFAITNFVSCIVAARNRRSSIVAADVRLRQRDGIVLSRARARARRRAPSPLVAV